MYTVRAVMGVQVPHPPPLRLGAIVGLIVTMLLCVAFWFGVYLISPIFFKLIVAFSAGILFAFALNEFVKRITSPYKNEIDQEFVSVIISENESLISSNKFLISPNDFLH